MKKGTFLNWFLLLFYAILKMQPWNNISTPLNVEKGWSYVLNISIRFLPAQELNFYFFSCTNQVKI